MYAFACGNGDESRQSGNVPGEDAAREKVLVFTKTVGYRHGSIPDGVSLVRRLGRDHDFNVDRTEDSGKFNAENLADYDLVIFLSTTGDVLNAEQQQAFENYIKGGGSFMGIHAAADTESGWPWYLSLVGAHFEGHPAVQAAEIRVEDAEHPSTSFLPDPWERTDEWYNYKDIKDGLNVLLFLDESTYEGGTNGENHPIAWWQEFEGGRSFYTGGGHTDESYREPLFEEHVLGGIEWCLKRKN